MLKQSATKMHLKNGRSSIYFDRNSQLFRAMLKRGSPASSYRNKSSGVIWCQDSFQLDDTLQGAVCESGLMTIAGFGSLLSERSACSTFPDLKNFRLGKVVGYRRVFAHTCSIFFERGIARPETGEVSSLSVEEHGGSEIYVTLFEIEATPEAISSFVEREHEFRFMAVRPYAISHENEDEIEAVTADVRQTAVICARNSDQAYKQTRCPPDEWERRYGRHGLSSIWRDDVLPCRVYLRHCVLAAKAHGTRVEKNFLDRTVLADRQTSLRSWLEINPDIMTELPPPSLVERYSG
jgi:hypothetical protein